MRTCYYVTCIADVAIYMHTLFYTLFFHTSATTRIYTTATFIPYTTLFRYLRLGLHAGAVPRRPRSLHRREEGRRDRDHGQRRAGPCLPARRRGREVARRRGRRACLTIRGRLPAPAASILSHSPATRERAARSAG